MATTQTIDTNAVFDVKAGLNTSNKRAKVGGAIFDYYTDAGNSGTSETDLYSSTIVPNIFGTNGDKITAFYGFTLVNSTSTKQVKFYYGGTALFDTGALTLSASGSLSINISMIRVDSSTLRYSIIASTTGASTATYATVGEATGIVFGKGSQTMKVTGTAAGVGAATNDIVAKCASISWIPAA